MLTEHDEKIIQDLEVIGLGIARAIKKIKLREYVMASKYLELSLKQTRTCMKNIRNGKNDKDKEV